MTEPLETSVSPPPPREERVRRREGGAGAVTNAFRVALVALFATGSKRIFEIKRP